MPGCKIITSRDEKGRPRDQRNFLIDDMRSFCHLVFLIPIRSRDRGAEFNIIEIQIYLVLIENVEIVDFSEKNLNFL